MFDLGIDLQKVNKDFYHTFKTLYYLSKSGLKYDHL